MNGCTKTVVATVMFTLSLFAKSDVPTVNFNLCKSSFTYKNVTYLGATDKDNQGKPWCYLNSALDGHTRANIDESTLPPVLIQPHTQPVANTEVDSIAFGSCWHDENTSTKTLERIAQQAPHLFLWLGDNIYADTTDMRTMRSKYDAKKTNSAYQQFLQAHIPVMATWDDHDFGANNEGKHYTQREASQAEFLRHFDVPPNDPRYAQEGIYNAQMFGTEDKKNRVQVIMLDARYHRSPTFENYGLCEGNLSTMLGGAQWTWLEHRLDLNAEITIIASGTQILPPTHLRDLDDYCAYADGVQFQQAITEIEESGLSGTVYESWAEMPLQRNKLLRLTQQAIASGKTHTVIFVSGDQHWGELLQKTIPATESAPATTVYEVTASGFGQKWPFDIENPNRMPVYADSQGDGMFTKQCAFPFRYIGWKYDGCTTRNHDQPWCYTKVDASGNGIEGEWGHCATGGTQLPAGRVGHVSDNIQQYTTADRYMINKSDSNYGLISINWAAGEITLSLQTETEEAISHIIPFRPPKNGLNYSAGFPAR